MPSTSAAAQALLTSVEDEADTSTTAAISSSLCATVFDGLQILCEDIQDVDSQSSRITPSFFVHYWKLILSQLLFGGSQLYTILRARKLSEC